jgi:hypothetical protein
MKGFTVTQSWWLGAEKKELRKERYARKIHDGSKYTLFDELCQ